MSRAFRQQSVRRRVALVGALVLAVAVVVAVVPRSSPSAPSLTFATELAPAGSKALKGSLYGISHANFLGPEAVVSARREAELAAAAGAEVFRFDLRWSTAEPQPGVSNERYWERVQRFADAVERAGMRQLIMVASAPEWAHGVSGCTRCNIFYPPADDPAFLQAWEDFVAEVVRRFPDAAIEVWNGPNAKAHFRHRGTDGTSYFQVLEHAYRGAKRADPDTTVVTGGMGANFLRSRDGNTAGGRFLERLYELGLKQKMPDIEIGMHIYPGKDLKAGSGSDFERVWSAVREPSVRHDDADRPLWITESGLPTSGPSGDDRTYATGATYKQQSKVLRTLTSRLQATAPVRTVLTHTLFDRPYYPEWHPEFGYGLIEPDGDVKPAYCSLAALQRERPDDC